MATDRVRDDIKDELRQMGVEKKLISLNADGGVYEEPPGLLMKTCPQILKR